MLGERSSGTLKSLDGEARWLVPAGETRVTRTFGTAPLELQELADHLVLARAFEVEPGGVAVRLRVLPEVLEARVAVAGPTRGLGVDFRKVTDHRTHRSRGTGTVAFRRRGKCPSG
jgi:hypothetical protein